MSKCCYYAWHNIYQVSLKSVLQFKSYCVTNRQANFLQNCLVETDLIFIGQIKKYLLVQILFGLFSNDRNVWNHRVNFAVVFVSIAQFMRDVWVGSHGSNWITAAATCENDEKSSFDKCLEQNQLKSNINRWISKNQIVR